MIQQLNLTIDLPLIRKRINTAHEKRLHRRRRVAARQVIVVAPPASLRVRCLTSSGDQDKREQRAAGGSKQTAH